MHDINNLRLWVEKKKKKKESQKVSYIWGTIYLKETKRGLMTRKYHFLLFCLPGIHQCISL